MAQYVYTMNRVSKVVPPGRHILKDISLSFFPGAKIGVLGLNGAGKSTFIKTMSGVHKPTSGTILFEGREMNFDSPRDSMEAGIATVYQDLAMIPLMSVTRNFWMGNEPVKHFGPIRLMDFKKANAITMAEMERMGINLREPNQAVGTLSGGERQTVAIARAVYFGAKLLILDEPTSALGVRQTANVWPTSTRCANRVSRWFSSPTTCATPWRSGTGLPFSTAARPLAPPCAAKSPPKNCRT